MSSKTLQLDNHLHDYLVRNTLRDQDILRQLRDETAQMEAGRMQISPEQGQFMQFLVRSIGARRTVEIGTFTGYSALVVALALPAGGKVVACDISEEYTAVARRYWSSADVSDKIDLRLAPAMDTLDDMLSRGEHEEYDFAFIDADKGGYDGYYERCLQLVRPRGLIAIDNMLWSGRVADESETDESTETIRALTKKIQEDGRVDMSLVPIGDGLMLACKR